MNDEEFRDWLIEYIKMFGNDYERTYIHDKLLHRPNPNTFKDIFTFKDIGILSDNKGLVFKMEDGSEFQISIVQSKNSNLLLMM